MSNSTQHELMEQLQRQLAAAQITLASLMAGDDEEENGLAIVDIRHELPVHLTEKYDTRPLGQIRQIIIHHTAVKDKATPQAIAKGHVFKNQWPGIGYHYYILRDGTVYQCNALTTVSYHAGTANARSIGVCLDGSFMTGRVPPGVQLQATRQLIKSLLVSLGLPADAVIAHKDVMSTACPGSTWAQWKTKIMP